MAPKCDICFSCILREIGVRREICRTLFFKRVPLLYSDWVSFGFYNYYENQQAYKRGDIELTGNIGLVVLKKGRYIA